jgi:hypothetical protein
MNSSKFDGTNVAVLQTGAFMAQQFQQAKALPPDAPCLTAVLTRQQFAAIANNQNGAGSFGLGSISGLNDDVMTIRCQIGDVQLYWLADMGDSEVWNAIDYWLKLGRVPIGLAQFDDKGSNYMFASPEWEIKNPPVNRFRGKQSTVAKQHLWKDISVIAKSGGLERTATTDIPGIKLKKVVVNVLMTKRLVENAQRTLLSGLRIRGAVPVAL